MGTKNIVITEEIKAALRRIGIEPNDTRRVVIDLQQGQPARIMTETIGDTRMLGDVMNAIVSVPREQIEVNGK